MEAAAEVSVPRTLVWRDVDGPGGLSRTYAGGSGGLGRGETVAVIDRDTPPGTRAIVNERCPLVRDIGKLMTTVTSPYWSDGRTALVVIVDGAGAEPSGYPIEWFDPEDEDERQARIQRA